MWTLDRVIFMGMLILLSARDIQSQQVPVCILIPANLLAAGWGLRNLIDGKGDIIILAGGIGVGAVFFLISKVTREGMGYGDSWVILILGIYLGLWKLLEVLAGAFFLLLLVSVICLTVRKMSRRCRIPFLPFLTAGYLSVILV